MTPPRRRKAHPRKTHPRHLRRREWGPQKGYIAPTYERLIGRQLSGVRVDAATEATLTRALLARRAPVDPQEAAAFIEGIAATRELATPAERARLVQATYERITVRGPSVVRVKLTPMAERMGLPALWPEEVPTEWAVARPTGVEHADAMGIRIPIEGVEIGLQWPKAPDPESGALLPPGRWPPPAIVVP